MPLTIAVAMPRKKYGQTSFPCHVDAGRTTQRAFSCYETEAGFPPAPALFGLALALEVTTAELVGVKPPKVERIDDDSEARRMWKRFQMVGVPERDQKAVSNGDRHGH